MSSSIVVKSNKLPRIRANLPGAVGKVIEKITEDAKGHAIARVAVDTGNLKNSISTAIERSGSKVEGVVYTQVEYAPYVEYGTRFNRAQPFFTPAADAVRPGLSAALGVLERSLL